MSVDIADKKIETRKSAQHISLKSGVNRLYTWRVMSTCIAVGIFLLINGLLQINRRYFDVLSDNDNSISRVNICESLGKVSEILYLGSSLTLHNIDPATIDAQYNAQHTSQITSCNLGADGSSFEEDYYTLKREIEDGYAPKLVVETIEELDVSANVNSDAFDLPNSRLPLLADVTDVGDLSYHYGSGYQKVLKSLPFIAQKMVPLYGDRTGLRKSISTFNIIDYMKSNFHLNILCRFRGNCSSKYPDSQVTNKDSWVPLSAPGMSTTEATNSYTYGSCGCHFKIDTNGRQISYLKRVIALAQQHHIQVALVQTPLNALYYQHVGFQTPAEWNTFIAFWKRFAQSQDVQFYDASHIQGFNDTDFMDLHHLEANGAEKFSAWLEGNVIETNINAE